MKSDLERRVLTALQDLRRRLEAAGEAVIVAVSAVHTELAQVELPDPGTAVFSTGDSRAVASLLGAKGPAVDVHGDEALAFHMAIHSVARGESVHCLAGAGSTWMVFSAMRCATRILATVTSKRMNDDAADIGPALASTIALGGTFAIGRTQLAFRRIAADPEDLVTSIVREVLGCSPENDRSLFECGLDSAKAIEIHARLERRSGRELPVTLVFEQPTIEQLRRFVDEATPVQVTAIAATYGQAALWQLDQMEPGRADYNIRTVFALRPNATPEAVGKAVEEIVRRHPVLRIRLIARDGGRTIEQVRGQPPSLDIWTGEDSSIEAIVRESLTPFNLEKGPLVRFTLLGRDRLLMTMHHAVTDYLSLRIVATELDEAIAAKPDARVMPPETDFFEYADAERGRLSKIEPALRAICERSLQGPLPILKPPAFRERNAAMCREGREYHSAPIDQTVVERLNEQAREARLSLFQLLFGAYAMLLMESTDATDLVVGTTIDNRPLGAKHSVGYFVNPVPVRFRLDAPGPVEWISFLAAHREAMLDAIKCRALPFARLVEMLAPPRRPFVTPIFQTMFTWLGVLSDDGENPLPGHQPAGVTHDLVLMARAGKRGLECRWCYKSPLYGAEDIVALALQYASLLTRIAEDPRSLVGSEGAQRQEIVL